MRTAGHGAMDDEPPLASASTDWRKYSRCATGTCVETRQVNDNLFGVRDSKQNHLADAQPVLSLLGASYIALLDEMAGLAPKGSNGEVDVVELDDGDTVFRSLTTGVELRFDQGEIDAFVAGIKAGEFLPQSQLVG